MGAILIYKKYFKFAFVRNPWDRAISQITYLRSSIGPGVFPGATFKEQLRNYCNTTKWYWAQDVGACQFDYLNNGSGGIGVDFIGRFETLAGDFQKACQMIGIEPAPALPHIFNSKRSAHYSIFYDAESAEWIRNRFLKDIEHFGYCFENIPVASVPQNTEASHI